MTIEFISLLTKQIGLEIQPTLLPKWIKHFGRHDHFISLARSVLENQIMFITFDPYQIINTPRGSHGQVAPAETYSGSVQF